MGTHEETAIRIMGGYHGRVSPTDQFMQEFGAIRRSGGCMFETYRLTNKTLSLIQRAIQPACSHVEIDVHYPAYHLLSGMLAGDLLACRSVRDVLSIAQVY